MNNADKSNINAAFATLKKLGYITRQCFQSDIAEAGYEIALDVAEMLQKSPNKIDKIRGAVFYHRQDHSRMLKMGELFIACGPVHIEGIGDVGVDSRTACTELVMALTEAGVTVEWDGDEMHRPLAKVPGAKIVSDESIAA